MCRLASFALVASSLTLLCIDTGYASPRGPIMPLDENAQPCVHPTRNLEGDVQLERRCIYDQSFRIKTANTVLDCQGAQLRADDAYQLEIKGTIDNVVVKNCYLTGGKGVAVRIRKGIHGDDHDALRAQSPTNIVIRNLSIVNSQHTGVYLHQYTVGVTVENSVILNSSAPGLYLAPYGRHHRIINNLIEGSGHRKPDGFPRIGWYRREGIAIDGSSEHLISGNDIINGALGGIMLYKNCWEHRYTNSKSRPRTDHARANIIENNRFARQPFGVWVASRQSRDLSQMGCGDPTPYENPIFVNDVFHPTFQTYPSAHADLYLLGAFMASVWPDFAEENEIRGNTFEDISRGGIRIEDDLTVVSHNLFIGDFDYIFVGAPFRARLAGQPVRGTEITNNSFTHAEADDFRAHLALIPDEHVETNLENNFRACTDISGRIIRHGDADRPHDADDEGIACHDGARRCRDGQFVEESCPDATDTGGSEYAANPSTPPTGGTHDPMPNAVEPADLGAGTPAVDSGGLQAVLMAGGVADHDAFSDPDARAQTVMRTDGMPTGGLVDGRAAPPAIGGDGQLNSTIRATAPEQSGCSFLGGTDVPVLAWLTYFGLGLLRRRRPPRVYRSAMGRSAEPTID
ncbi:MAG: right-handed parallel beta-helix repeat-containing protein [Myxococcota bacterium]|nr:right-handed parallel beta-helix repeat-containing protein [Myxococcota bacterium]